MGMLFKGQFIRKKKLNDAFKTMIIKSGAEGKKKVGLGKGIVLGEKFVPSYL